MASLLRIPEVAAGATEAILTEWLVKERVPFAAGDPVAPSAGGVRPQLAAAREKLEANDLPGAYVLLQGAPRQLADPERGERLGQLRGEHVGQRCLGIASAGSPGPCGLRPLPPEEGLNLVLVQVVRL